MKSFFQTTILIFVGALAFITIQDHFQEYGNVVSNLNQSTTSLILNDLRSLGQQKQDLASPSEIYHIYAVGDIMLDRGVWSRVINNDGDFDFPFDLIREDLKRADFVFGNLEGSLSDVGSDTGKEYSFRFKPGFADVLNRASFDVVSLANNHMMDWGRTSLCQTTKNLDEARVGYVGAGCDSESAERPYMQRVGNTNVAILAYTEFYIGAHATDSRAGMTEYNLDKIAQRIADLEINPDVDVVMVSFHGGTEYKHRSNTYQQETYKQFIDAGADIVLGHHPHVPQEIERYADGWIAYSLGNFVFDQSRSEETMKGLMVDIHVQGGDIVDVQPIPLQINNNFQPYIIKS